MVGCKIPGVNLGYDKSRQVKFKNASVKLIVLDSENDHDNIGESTGVDMHAHEVVRHGMVSPMDQKVGGKLPMDQKVGGKSPMDQKVGGFRIKGKVADFGQQGVNLCEGSTKLTAGKVHNQAEYANEAAVHGWIRWRNSNVDGMIVKGESSC